jgi:hypothetical protein
VRGVVEHHDSEALSVPEDTTACCPQVQNATATEFELVNPKKQSNFILGEVSTAGELTFVVENQPKTSPTTGCPGWWLFEQMMNHFQSVGTAVTAIVGSWTYGDNLATVNTLTGTGGMPLQDAAKQTATARYATSRQYHRVAIDSAVGTPGNYSKVRVLFTK